MDASSTPDRRGFGGRVLDRLSGRTVREVTEQRDRAAQEAARLRRRLQKLEQARTRLERRVSRMEPRDDLDYLFVLTYGRSGSTLLQGVLNSVPGYVIRGENRQMLRELYDYHRTGVKLRNGQRRGLQHRPGDPASTSPANPFFGMDGYPRKRAIEDIRRLAVDTLLRPEPGTRVTGFKEIRWATEDVGDFVAWLQEVFPGCRFIINTRILADVARSSWWAGDPASEELLAATEERLLRLGEGLEDAAFHVRYDDYVTAPATLASLFAWLGEPFDEQSVRDVMAVRHSY